VWRTVTGHIFVRLWPFFVPTLTVARFYQLLWFVSFHLSSLVMVYVMVESFRFYVTKIGRLWDVLNLNSYGVFIIHMIVIGMFGSLLLYTDLPVIAK
jgi:hypothetical protein